MDDEESKAKSKENSTGRVEALSDGVFAVALTLLVLDVKVPSNQTVHELGSALWNLAPHVLIFVLSFLIVTFYWTAHHVLFASIRRSNRVLLWVNAVHLLFIVFLPFTTGLLAEFPTQRIAVIIYALNVIASSLSSIAVWRYATDRHRLIDSDVPQKTLDITTYRLMVNPVVCTIAIAVSYLNTIASIALFVVTPIWYLVTGPRASAAEPGFWPGADSE